MLQVPAALLPYPTLNYGNGDVNLNDPRNAKDGKWNLNRRRFLKTNPQSAFKVFMIYVPRENVQINLSPQEVRLIFEEFKKAVEVTYNAGKATLFGIEKCPKFTQPGVAQKTMTMAKDKGANFVYLLLENKSTAAYSVFKDLADRNFGMHSLCSVFKGKRFQQGPYFSDQYWGNVIMKINLKAGGINHTVREVPQVMKDTLVLGA